MSSIPQDPAPNDPARAEPEPAPGRDPDENGSDLVETVPTGHGRHEAEDDVVSDPALDDKVGSDWVDEGGATPSGPSAAPDAATSGSAP